MFCSRGLTMLVGHKFMISFMIPCGLFQEKNEKKGKKLYGFQGGGGLLQIMYNLPPAHVYWRNIKNNVEFFCVPFKLISTNKS